MANPLIIDVHMHVFSSKREGRKQVDSYDGWEFEHDRLPPYSKYDGDLADALDSMKVAGVSRAIFVHIYLPLLDRYEKVQKLPPGTSEAERRKAIEKSSEGMKEGLKKSNVWACQLAKDHPQILPFISIDPWVLGPQEARDHLVEMMEKHGARGIKLHSVLQQFFMGNRRMWPVYEACTELGLPIIAHSGRAKGPSQHGDPHAFAEAFKAFPKLKLVMAHLGNGAWRQTKEVAQASPNAMFDTCELIEWYGAPVAPTPLQLAQLIKDVGPQRVMMGTDFPWWDHAHCIDKVMELPLLSMEEKEGILGANAARLLGI